MARAGATTKTTTGRGEAIPDPREREGLREETKDLMEEREEACSSKKHPHSRLLRAKSPLPPPFPPSSSSPRNPFVSIFYLPFLDFVRPLKEDDERMRRREQLYTVMQNKKREARVPFFFKTAPSLFRKRKVVEKANLASNLWWASKICHFKKHSIFREMKQIGERAEGKKEGEIMKRLKRAKSFRAHNTTPPPPSKHFVLHFLNCSS